MFLLFVGFFYIYGTPRSLKGAEQTNTFEQNMGEHWERARTDSDIELEYRLQQDLGYGAPETTATLRARSGNFLLFNINVEPEGGGFSVLARMKNDGHFEKIWAGQDVYPCEIIDRFNVPRDLAPDCLSENKRIDRFEARTSE